MRRRKLFDGGRADPCANSPHGTVDLGKGFYRASRAEGAAKLIVDQAAMTDIYDLRLFRQPADLHACRSEQHACAGQAEAMAAACDLLRRTREAVAVEAWLGGTLAFRIGEPPAAGNDRTDSVYADRCGRAWGRVG
jgi:hypothetical protein